MSPPLVCFFCSVSLLSPAPILGHLEEPGGSGLGTQPVLSEPGRAEQPHVGQPGHRRWEEGAQSPGQRCAGATAGATAEQSSPDRGT